MTTEQELELQKKKKKNIDISKLEEQIELVDKEIEKIWDDKEEIETNLRQKIRQSAEMRKERNTILGVEFLNNQIAIEMFRRFKYKPGLQEYIAHTLIDDYKRKYTKEECTSGILSPDRSPIEECSVMINEIIQALKSLKEKYPEDLGRASVQDIAQLLYDCKNRIEKQAEQYKIPLPYEKDRLGDDDDEGKEQQEDSPLSDDEIILAFQEFFGENEMSGLRDDFNKLAEQVLIHNYVPWNRELLEDGSLTWHAFRSLMRPLLDKKWQRDWGEWCDILEDYHEQGGTYASSKSAVDVADLKNQKTGEPQRRKITKEQIDATHDEYLNEMRFIITNLRTGGKFGNQQRRANSFDKINPKTRKVIKHIFTHEQLKPLEEHFNPTVRSIIDEMRQTIEQYRPIHFLFKFYRENERGFRAKRAVKLGPKLSDKA